MEATAGPILCSGPTNGAIDNLADRVYRISESVTTRSNQRKSDSMDATHRRLVVRTFRIEHELNAFMALLEGQDDAEAASVRSRRRGPSKWRLHLSATYWLLVLLGSSIEGVADLHPQDSKALQDLRRDFDQRPDLALLRSRAQGKISRDEFHEKAVDHDALVRSLLRAIIRVADILCVTPAVSENDEECHKWKSTRARGIAVDEAASMTRPDLLSVWGNCLLPCFLAGDIRQLPPTVMTVSEKDLHGNLLNRHPADGRVSPMEFFEASGMPVYRCRVQLRMANGLFDLVGREIYDDLNNKYHARCNVNHPAFASGVALEKFLRSRHSELVAPAHGHVAPAFVHCEGSFVRKGLGFDKSKTSRDQVKIALGLAFDIVKGEVAKPGQITIISAYAGNVKLLSRLRKRPEYSQVLAGMPDPTTIDGCQGQENDIIIALLGTNESTGPGFTSNANRFNVMMTRAKCGLVVVGDKHVLRKAEKKGGASQSILVEGPSGEPVYTTPQVLRNVLKELGRAGRIVNVKVEKAKKAEKGGENVGGGEVDEKKKEEEEKKKEEEEKKKKEEKKKRQREKREREKKEKEEEKKKDLGGEEKGV